MADKRTKKTKKPIKPVKRVINWECYNPYTKLGQDICSLRVTYIIDTGNLIQDVQVKYVEFVGEFNAEQKAAKIQKYAKSKENVQRRLKNLIYATGANRYTAEKTAHKLLTENKMVAVR